MQRFETMGKRQIIDFLQNRECDSCTLNGKCDFYSRFCGEAKMAYLTVDIPSVDGDFPALRGAIERGGFTVREFAKECGMSVSTLSEKMSGKVDWKLREMEKICRVLNARMDVLFSH